MREFSRFVGVPYLDLGRGPSGWDCYGLVYWINNAILHRPVPSYLLAYPSAVDTEHVASAIEFHRAEWSEVSRDRMQPGDTLVFTIAGIPMHCGIAYDETRMMHCLAGHETVIEGFNSPAWTRRLVGVYRWS